MIAIHLKSMPPFGVEMKISAEWIGHGLSCRETDDMMVRIHLNTP
jgi:hypothetical protein